MTAVLRDAATLLEPVRRELVAIAQPVTDLRVLASGLEFAVFSARWQGLPVVVKAPWVRQIANDNDPAQDARDLMRQEAGLLRFARAHGVPAPEVAFLHVDGDVDVLATAFVPSDGSPARADDLAGALASLHAATPPAIPLVAQPGEFATVLAERVSRRAGVVERLAGVRLGLPGAGELAGVLPAPGSPAALLHLDLRAANVLTVEGRIVGLVDWTNALVGDPVLELARLDEYGSAPPGFVASYRDVHPHEAPAARELLYRLDAAVMLAVVFLSEAPDPREAPARVARAVELAAALGRAMGP
jgi:aminoglycoside phosphotransferase (APT) family kinase protein